MRLCTGPDCFWPDAISTEHNHDAYSAFFWRGVLDVNEIFLSRAQLILEYLSREMWGQSSDSNCQYNENVFWRGFDDYGWCTDTQSWGVLSLGPYGPLSENFYLSMDWLWYSPWGNTRVAQDFNDSILNVDGFKPFTDEMNDFIWVEGTEGVAAAYYSICDETRGDYFHGQMTRVVSENGGLPYSFSEIDPDEIRWIENWRLNSVAATCWYYFNEKRINPFDMGDANLFFSLDYDMNKQIDFF